MTKSCRKVLSGLRKLSGSSDAIMAFLDNTTCICLIDDFDKTFDYSKYIKEIESTIRHLVKEEYLKYSINDYHFTLTTKGLHPYHFKWETLKSFLLKSVAVPIVVSVATSLTVLWLQGLL